MSASLPPCLEVMSPGLLTTLQDSGRYGYTDLGLPVAGAVDPLSLSIANLLAGNSHGAPALEITMAGPELTVLRACTIALAGADFAVRLDRDLPLRPGASYLLRAGSTLTFNSPRNGARAYLALAGGIAAPEVLGASSTYLAGGIGGIDGSGSPLRSGDLIAPAHRVDAITQAGRYWPSSAITPSAPVRVIPGPHLDYFNEDALAALCSGDWTVSAKSDRMGLRLEGFPLERSPNMKGELLSQGVVRGAIQVPADGLPIVLLADHQTTGGYPVVGVVARADWPILAQKPPGAPLRFTLTTLEQAQEAYRAQMRELAAVAVELQRQKHHGGIDWLDLAAWAGDAGSR